MIGSEFLTDPFSVAGAGATFGVVFRWLFGLDIARSHAACIGAVTCALIPLACLCLSPPFSIRCSGDFVLGTAMTSWLLVIADAIQSP